MAKKENRTPALASMGLTMSTIQSSAIALNAEVISAVSKKNLGKLLTIASNNPNPTVQLFALLCWFQFYVEKKSVHKVDMSRTLRDLQDGWRKEDGLRECLGEITRACKQFRALSKGKEQEFDISFFEKTLNEYISYVISGLSSIALEASLSLLAINGYHFGSDDSKWMKNTQDALTSVFYSFSYSGFIKTASKTLEATGIRFLDRGMQFVIEKEGIIFGRANAQNRIARAKLYETFQICFLYNYHFPESLRKSWQDHLGRWTNFDSYIKEEEKWVHSLGKGEKLKLQKSLSTIVSTQRTGLMENGKMFGIDSFKAIFDNPKK